MKTVVKGLNGEVSLFTTYSIIDAKRNQPKNGRLVLALFKDGMYGLMRYTTDGKWRTMDFDISKYTPDFWMDIPTYIKDWVRMPKTKTKDSPIKVLSWGAKH